MNETPLKIIPPAQVVRAGERALFQVEDPGPANCYRWRIKGVPTAYPHKDWPDIEAPLYHATHILFPESGRFVIEVSRNGQQTATFEAVVLAARPSDTLARAALDRVAEKLGVSRSDPPHTVDQVEGFALRKIADAQAAYQAVAAERDVAVVALQNLGFAGGDVDPFVAQLRQDLVDAQNWHRLAFNVSDEKLVPESPAGTHVLDAVLQHLRVAVQVRERFENIATLYDRATADLQAIRDAAFAAGFTEDPRAMQPGTLNLAIVAWIRQRQPAAPPVVPTAHLVDETPGPAPEHVIAGLHHELEAARRLLVQTRAGREAEERACFDLFDGLTPPEAPATPDLHGLLSVWVPQLRLLLANEASTLKLRDDLRAALAVDPADNAAILQRAANLLALRESVVEHLGRLFGSGPGRPAPAAMPRAAAQIIREQGDRIRALEGDLETLRSELAAERGEDTSAATLARYRVELAAELGLSERVDDGRLIDKVKSAIAGDRVLDEVRAALKLPIGQDIMTAIGMLQARAGATAESVGLARELAERGNNLGAYLKRIAAAVGVPDESGAGIAEAVENMAKAERQRLRIGDEAVELLQRFAAGADDPPVLACARGALAYIDNQAALIGVLETERDELKREVAELCKLREQYLAGADGLHAVADVVRDEAKRRAVATIDGNLARAATIMFEADQRTDHLVNEATEAAGLEGRWKLVEWCRESAAIRKGVREGTIAPD